MSSENEKKRNFGPLFNINENSCKNLCIMANRILLEMNDNIGIISMYERAESGDFLIKD